MARRYLAGDAVKRCPLCERIWPQKTQPPLWQKLKRYADGTRGYKELAQLADSTPGSVAVALTRMRREGIEVRGKGTAPERVPTRQEYDQAKDLRSKGLTWKQIATHLGISPGLAYKRKQQLEAAFGKLPGNSRGVIRDRVRDYIRIRELRVDAQLPWKMVGASLGMNQQYVAKYFSELCKVYGG